MCDRAVSDLIGFVLIFGMILSTVGVVYVFGVGGLEDARDAERLNNAERAFDVLADNMGDLHKRDAPSRATEMKLADADLRFGSPTTFNVTNVSSGNYTAKSVDPIVYSTGGETEIAYVNGGVIRTERNGGVMLRDPDTVFATQNGNRVVIIPIVETRAEGSTQIGGGTTALIRSKAVTSDLLMTIDDSSTRHDVEIQVTTSDVQRAVVWERHLEADIPDAWGSNVCDRSVSDTTVTCTVAVDELYVPRTGIAVRFS